MFEVEPCVQVEAQIFDGVRRWDCVIANSKFCYDFGVSFLPGENDVFNFLFVYPQLPGLVIVFQFSDVDLILSQGGLCIIGMCVRCNVAGVEGSFRFGEVRQVECKEVKEDRSKDRALGYPSIYYSGVPSFVFVVLEVIFDFLVEFD
jgi:hypothetical protein